MDVYPHWQPAIAVIIVHLFNLFTWTINSLSLLKLKLYSIDILRV